MSELFIKRVYLYDSEESRKSRDINKDKLPF